MAEESVNTSVISSFTQTHAAGEVTNKSQSCSSSSVASDLQAEGVQIKTLPADEASAEKGNHFKA